MKRHSSELFEEDSICRYSFSKKKNNHVKKPKLYLYSWIVKKELLYNVHPPPTKDTIPNSLGLDEP
jgi:hypothetical protein